MAVTGGGGRRARLFVFMLALGVAFLLQNGRALAGTASVTGSTLNYEADSGEINTVTVEPTSLSYAVTDNSATVTVGLGCTAVDSHHATCSAPGISSIKVNAGDENDSVTISDTWLPTLLVGDAGDDALRGSFGNNTLRGGTGADFLTATGANIGFDTFDYSDHLAPSPSTSLIICPTAASRTGSETRLAASVTKSSSAAQQVTYSQGRERCVVGPATTR